MNTLSADPQSLNLRDIHLPDPISWWPIASGWWLMAAAVFLLLAVIYIARKIYISRQIKRDISSEINAIKQQYQQTQNKSELAQSLSILLRRASISFYPAKDIAGITGEDWLTLLDETNKSNSTKFTSDIGRLLITAPYQSEESLIDFEIQPLIKLCESWLYSSHSKMLTSSQKKYRQKKNGMRKDRQGINHS